MQQEGCKEEQGTPDKSQAQQGSVQDMGAGPGDPEEIHVCCLSLQG